MRKNQMDVSGRLDYHRMMKNLAEEWVVQPNSQQTRTIEVITKVARNLSVALNMEEWEDIRVAAEQFVIFTRSRNDIKWFLSCILLFTNEIDQAFFLRIFPERKRKTHQDTLLERNHRRFSELMSDFLPHLAEEDDDAYNFLTQRKSSNELTAEEITRIRLLLRRQILWEKKGFLDIRTKDEVFTFMHDFC